MNTLDYYNRNAQAFSDNTVNVAFTGLQDRFLQMLPTGAHILDFGCGSGRDTKYFLEQGYSVEAVDGSAELCRLATAHCGIPVKQMLFQELHAQERYDGIWACASILHLPPQELQSVLVQMAEAVKPGGIIYASFKYGTFCGERNGRYFTDMTEETFAQLTEGLPLHVEASWITGDARPGRETEPWLNLLLRKPETGR